MKNETIRRYDTIEPLTRMGWQFFHRRGGETVSLNPGLYTDEWGDLCVFVQVVADGFSHCFYGDKVEFSARQDRTFVRVDSSSFSEQGVELNLRDGGITVRGCLRYRQITAPPVAPGARRLWRGVDTGHERIHSLCHTVEGSLWIGGRPLSLTGGTGSITQDTGTGEPCSRLWLSCQSPPPGASGARVEGLTILSRRIPAAGRTLHRFTAALLLDGQLLTLSSGEGHRLSTQRTGERLTVCLAGRGLTICGELPLEHGGAYRTPGMDGAYRTVERYPGCGMSLSITRWGKPVYEGRACPADCELAGRDPTEGKIIHCRFGFSP